MRTLVQTSVLLLIGCTAPTDPVVEAHRGAAGYYPQNSRTAMNASIDDGYDGIELDLVLTLDHIPVLAHDPWVHTELCTTAAGLPVPERIRIDSLTYEELTAGFLCGGVPDPDFPNAAIVAEPMMPLDDLVTRLYIERPELVVHLDMKYEPGWTLPADAYAEAVLSRWVDADLPQPFYVSSAYPEMIEAAEDWSSRAGFEVDTSLSWPRFQREGSVVGQAIVAELSSTTGTQAPLLAAEDVGADGLNLQWEVTSLSQVRSAKAAGLSVQLWTLNDPSALKQHARWPVDALITDFPGDVP